TVLFFGTNSCKSSSRLALSGVLKMLMPVALPPGRLKLATSPTRTGVRYLFGAVRRPSPRSLRGARALHTRRPSSLTANGMDRLFFRRFPVRRKPPPAGGGSRALPAASSPSIALLDLYRSVVDRRQHLRRIAGDDDVDHRRAVAFFHSSPQRAGQRFR